MRRFADHPATVWVLAAAAMLLAAVGAQPYAGSWNDGCRLAAVESLIDRHTLAIDDSIFCHPPQHLIDAGIPPYPPDRPDLLASGTLDKLFVRGHFHSDKPAVISILMAGAYHPFLWLGVPPPSERPDLFCWWMTVLTSGLGYGAAVGVMWALGTRIGLSPGWRLAWVGSFACSTFTLTYTQYVNNHTMHLGVVAGLCLLLVKVVEAHREGHIAWGSFVGLGSLTGLGFNLDFGSGPLLVGAVFGVVALRFQRIGPVLAYTIAVTPWVVAAMGLNYAIGGVWKPLNMYPEHYLFPGTPFTQQNLTGFLRHEPLNQALYAGGMILGKHGFSNHNLPLLLAGATGWLVLRRPFPARTELLALLGWCGATWLLFAFLSNNMGGACCSVRWFMPFLAPGFWILALLLRDRPEFRADFVALSLWGGVLAGIMWQGGPWTPRMVPMMWPIVGAALLTWVAIAFRRWRSMARNAKLQPAIGPKTTPGVLTRKVA